MTSIFHEARPARGRGRPPARARRAHVPPAASRPGGVGTHTRRRPGSRTAFSRGPAASLGVVNETHAREKDTVHVTLEESNNIAARMGRWSASHWKTAVFGWLAFVVAAIAVGTRVGTKTDRPARHQRRPVAREPTRSSSTPGSRPTRRPRSSLVQSKQLDRRRPGVPGRDRRRRRDASRRSRTIENLRSPLDPATPTRSRADGHTAMVEWDMSGELRRPPRSTSTRSPRRPPQSPARHPGFYIGEAGSISSGKALNEAVQRAARAGG